MPKKFIVILGLIIVVGTVITLAVGKGPRPQKTDKIQVTASFYPLYFFSEQIGGKFANVKNITPYGAEPHDYEPTARDIIQIEDSKLIVLCGLNFEVWANDIKQNINPKITTLLLVGEGLDVLKGQENGRAVIDPHIWLDPFLSKLIVDKIVQDFEKIDPVNRNYYYSNGELLKTKLDKLDNLYRNGLNNCQQKNIVTSHDAFGYLAAAYGFNQVSIGGLSPEEEPSPQQLTNIAKFARDNNVKYIFFESLVSPKFSQTIANEIGAQTLVLNPLEGLSGEDLAQGKNYFTEMEKNLDNLKIALQCQN